VYASPNAFNASLYDHLRFNFIRDIAPVASVSRYGGVMQIHPSVPASTVPELIAFAKANPGKIMMVSTGAGSAPGLWGQLFKSMTGLDLSTIGYSGSAPALIDLLSGRVQLMFDVVMTAMGPIKAKQVRALAVTTAKRIAELPEIPPLTDFVPGYDAFGWQGIGAPRGTSADIIDTLHAQINAALNDDEFKMRLTEMGAELFPSSSPAEFGRFMVQYTEKWARIIRAAGLKGD
jgi:tripartite-type tricarboxylate transporter receptor subunit TctC